MHGEKLYLRKPKPRHGRPSAVRGKFPQPVRPQRLEWRKLSRRGDQASPGLGNGELDAPRQCVQEWIVGGHTGYFAVRRRGGNHK